MLKTTWIPSEVLLTGHGLFQQINQTRGYWPRGFEQSAKVFQVQRKTAKCDSHLLVYFFEDDIHAWKIWDSDSLGQPIFSVGQVDNHDILFQWLNISKTTGLIVIRSQGMTCMMFIPCILVQEKAETRLNRKQY